MGTQDNRPQAFLSILPDDLVTFDVEANGLDDATKIWFVVFYEGSGTIQTFKNVTEDQSERAALCQYLSGLSVLGGHHSLGYDVPTLSRLVPDTRPYLDGIHILDSLVVSKLINYRRPGGHSLESFGHEFGIQKQGVDIEDWTRPTELMLQRCISDVKITRRVFEKFWRFLVDPEWGPSLRSEHFVARVCSDMHWNGFNFDAVKAQEMQKNLSVTFSERLKAIREAFPPKLVLDRHVTPKRTKAGVLGVSQFKWLLKDQEYVLRQSGVEDRVVRGRVDGVLDLSDFDGSEFDVYVSEDFNPGSPRQVVERLNAMGWKPTEKTKSHADATKEKRITDAHREFGWKVSEENLSTLPSTAPTSAFQLAEYLTIASRLSDLAEWLALVEPDGKIHGRFNSIGAWTERVSHQRPNTANVPQSKPSDKDTEFQASVQILNGQMRQLWVASKGKRLIGTDADGVQMRIFAHLCHDENLIEALVNGRKENATDIHSLNRQLLGSVCGSRDVAKTFIYAFLLGAGTGRVASILGCKTSAAKSAVASFVAGLPGLGELKTQRIPREAAQGYFVGLDGRKIVCDSEHLMLSGHLQNGEKVIMSRWIEEWTRKLDKEKVRYSIVNWVHDETQTEIDDDDDLCQYVQSVQIDAMVKVGSDLGLLCPLKATSAWGYDWHATH